jgi:acetyltransferase-like isoleucine patch superfamily enzyme
MRQSKVHAAVHRVRMIGRSGVNRMSCRRSIRGRGHVIVATGAVLRNVKISVRGSGHRIQIEPQARLSDLVIDIVGSGHRLLIGADVRIHAASMNFYDDGCTISIGDRTSIYEATFGIMEGGRISIGEECLIASQVDLRNGDSHSILDVATGDRLNPSADIVIGDHVWIGARAMMLKGSRVAADSVVAAGAIVTGTFPEGSVVAGVPARVVADGVTWRPERL